MTFSSYTSVPSSTSITAIRCIDLTPGTATGNDGINIPCSEYSLMQQYWGFIDLVADGFESARNSASSIIIEQYGEKSVSYDTRLKHLDFLPLFNQLTALSAALLTRKAITVVGDENPIKRELEDIDGLGNSIDVFIHDFLIRQLKYSLGFVLVDAPAIPRDENGTQIPLNPDVVNSLNLRPYWSIIDAKDVIGHRFIRNGAKHTLVQARIKCTHRIPDGKFGEKIVPAIKVYDLISGLVQVSMFVNTKNEWMEELSQRSTINLPYIPLFCMNTNPVDLFCARPDLYELAVLNINHARVSSDLLFSLNLAAHPKLKRMKSSDYVTDFRTTQPPVDMSPDQVIDTQVGEDYVWLSVPSDSFIALQDKIAKYEVDAKNLWLATVQPQNTFAESGLSKSIGQNQGSSKLLRIAIALESLLERCVKAHFDLMDYRNIPEEPPIKLSVSRDLDALSMGNDIAALLSDMVQTNQLSLESMLLMLKRGQLLPEDFDIEHEVEKLGMTESLQPYDILTQLKDLGSLPIDYDINAAIAKLNGQAEE